MLKTEYNLNAKRDMKILDFIKLPVIAKTPYSLVP